MKTKINIIKNKIKENIMKINIIIYLFINLAFYNSNVFYAYSGSTGDSSFNSLLTNYYSILLPLITILLVCIIVTMEVIIMFTKTQKVVDDIRKYEKKVAVAWLCFACIGAIAYIASAWAGDPLTSTDANSPLFKY